MVATLQLKTSKLIVYFVSFTVVIFTILSICLILHYAVQRYKENYNQYYTQKVHTFHHEFYLLAYSNPFYTSRFLLLGTLQLSK